MAVYVEVSEDVLGGFLNQFDTGALVSSKGIVEGVSNSNFLVETTTDRFILTLYEHRIDPDDLPFFINLMEHLANKGLPVPRPIRDRDGVALHRIAGRAACMIQFLSGVSVSAPTPAQTRAAAAALAALHLAGASFPELRANHLSLPWWQQTAHDLGAGLDRIEPGLAGFVHDTLRHLTMKWPTDLPTGIIHADLFPDNVLMLGDQVTGLIDFYFSCTDSYAYDLAVFLTAWAFAPDGGAPMPEHMNAALQGYESVRKLSAAEHAALPLLGQGAALRFLLSRAQDWLTPDADALVHHKDPVPFANRLRHYVHHAA
ncbi:MAG: homoserine kinase [Sphingomonadaceae bacterium]